MSDRNIIKEHCYSKYIKAEKTLRCALIDNQFFGEIKSQNVFEKKKDDPASLKEDCNVIKLCKEKESQASFEQLAKNESGGRNQGK